MKGKRAAADGSVAEEVRFRSPLDARGFTMLWNVVLMDQRVSDGALRTYMTLCFHARQADRCWPGQAVLAQERGCSLRAVQMHLAELESRGLIGIERRGKTLSNVYWIEDVRDAYAAPAKPKVTRKKLHITPESDTQKTAYHPSSDTQKTAPHRKKTQPLEEDSRSNNNKPAAPEPAPQPQPLVVAPDLMERLVETGVTPSVAQALAANYPIERIEKQIAQLPYRRADEPGAVLVKAIREDWAAPEGWRRAQSERKKQERQAQKEQERQAAAEAERVAEAERDTRITALWESLTDAERADLDTRAEAVVHEQEYLSTLWKRRKDSPLVQSVVKKRRAELLSEMLAASR